MKKKIVFHCGMHKTGTTAIQKFLADNQAWIRPQAQILNRHFEPNFDIRTRTLRSSLLQYTRKKISFDEMCRRVFPIAQDIQFDKTPLCIVSDESLFGEHLGYGGIAQVYPQMDSISRILVDIFDFADVEFLVYTRNQDRWIESIWKQCLKMSQTDLSFFAFRERYKAPLDWKLHFHSSLTPEIRGRFTIFSYEEEMGARQDRPDAFLRHMRIKVPEKIVPLQQVNVSKVD